MPFPPPIYSSTDYLAQFQRLLPRGRVWHRGWGLLQDADLLTLMPLWARLHVRLNDLITEIFPCTTNELLPEWEATLGLPDPCTGPLDTLQARTAAVCTKFAARGGQSIQYFIDLAAAHGFPIEIEQYAPFRVNINSADDPLYDSAWAFAFVVVSPSTEIVYFRADLSAADEPLADWGNNILECLIRANAPAHTIPMFEYTDKFSIWDVGASIWDGGASVWDQWGVNP